jgi:membrane-associated protease RseP (regulator of RpoE activity)
VDNIGAERVPVIVQRDGRRITLFFDPDRWGYARSRRFERDDYRGGGGAWLGVTLDRRYDDAAVVRDVVPDSPAEFAGVRQGDWIVRLNGRRVTSASHLTSLVDSMRPGEEVDVEVARRVTRNLVATLEGQERSQAAREVYRPLDGQGQYRLERPGYRTVEPVERFDPDRDRRGLRDRFGPAERGLRDRLDRDEIPDEPSILGRP